MEKDLFTSENASLRPQDDSLLSRQTKSFGLVLAAGASDADKEPHVLQLRTERKKQQPGGGMPSIRKRVYGLIRTLSSPNGNEDELHGGDGGNGGTAAAAAAAAEGRGGWPSPNQQFPAGDEQDDADDHLGRSPPPLPEEQSFIYQYLTGRLKRNGNPEIYFGKTGIDLPSLYVAEMSPVVIATHSGPDGGLTNVPPVRKHGIASIANLDDELSISMDTDSLCSRDFNNQTSETTTSAGGVRKGLSGSVLDCASDVYEFVDNRYTWDQPRSEAFGQSTSLYECNPLTKVHAGHPVADVFGIMARENSSIMALADGVNWGDRARLAARCAIRGAIEHVNEELFHCSPDKLPKSTHDIFHTLLGSFHAGHQLILQEGGMLTTLCVAVCAPLRNSEDWVVCACNVGDSLCFVYNKDGGVREVTLGSHDISEMRDMRDAGGALGPVDGVNPELQNLTCSMTVVQQGDIVFITSDGVSDNFDPVVGKFCIMKSEKENKSGAPQSQSSTNNSKTATDLMTKPQSSAQQQQHPEPIKLHPDRPVQLRTATTAPVLINNPHNNSTPAAVMMIPHQTKNGAILGGSHTAPNPKSPTFDRQSSVPIAMNSTVSNTLNGVKQQQPLVSPTRKATSLKADNKSTEIQLPAVEAHQRHELMLLRMEDLLRHGITIGDPSATTAKCLASNLINFAQQLTMAKRRTLEDPDLYQGDPKLKKMDQRQRRRLVRQKIAEMPGKLDHATVVAYSIGPVHSGDSSTSCIGKETPKSVRKEDLLPQKQRDFGDTSELEIDTEFLMISPEASAAITLVTTTATAVGVSNGTHRTYTNFESHTATIGLVPNGDDTSSSNKQPNMSKSVDTLTDESEFTEGRQTSSTSTTKMDIESHVHSNNTEETRILEPSAAAINNKGSKHSLLSSSSSKNSASASSSQQHLLTEEEQDEEEEEEQLTPRKSQNHYPNADEVIIEPVELNSGRFKIDDDPTTMGAAAAVAQNGTSSSPATNKAAGDIQIDLALRKDSEIGFADDGEDPHLLTMMTLPSSSSASKQKGGATDESSSTSTTMKDSTNSFDPTMMESYQASENGVKFMDESSHSSSVSSGLHDSTSSNNPNQATGAGGNPADIIEEEKADDYAEKLSGSEEEVEEKLKCSDKSIVEVVKQTTKKEDNQTTNSRLDSEQRMKPPTSLAIEPVLESSIFSSEPSPDDDNDDGDPTGRNGGTPAELLPSPKISPTSEISVSVELASSRVNTLSAQITSNITPLIPADDRTATANIMNSSYITATTHGNVLAANTPVRTVSTPVNQLDDGIPLAGGDLENNDAQKVDDPSGGKEQQPDSGTLKRGKNKKSISKAMESIGNTLQRRKHKRGSPSRHTVAVDGSWLQMLGLGNKGTKQTNNQFDTGGGGNKTNSTTPCDGGQKGKAKLTNMLSGTLGRRFKGIGSPLRGTVISSSASGAANASTTPTAPAPAPPQTSLSGGGSLVPPQKSSESAIMMNNNSSGGDQKLAEVGPINASIASDSGHNSNNNNRNATISISATSRISVTKKVLPAEQQPELRRKTHQPPTTATTTAAAMIAPEPVSSSSVMSHSASDTQLMTGNCRPSDLELSSRGITTKALRDPPNDFRSPDTLL